MYIYIYIYMLAYSLYYKTGVIHIKISKIRNIRCFYHLLMIFKLSIVKLVQSCYLSSMETSFSVYKRVIIVFTVISDDLIEII